MRVREVRVTRQGVDPRSGASAQAHAGQRSPLVRDDCGMAWAVSLGVKSTKKRAKKPWRVGLRISVRIRNYFGKT
jgi:hypothetical protein